MKPLTIEQLKSLEVGDWVWVTTADGKYGAYGRVCERFDEDNFRTETIESYLVDSYDTYGTKWLAYKNKEQAEAKGEIVELPCKIGDTVWTVAFVFMDGWVGNKMKSESDWRKSNKVIKDKIDLYKFLIVFEKGNGFLTEPEAERRLAELKGERK